MFHQTQHFQCVLFVHVVAVHYSQCLVSLVGAVSVLEC